MLVYIKKRSYVCIRFCCTDWLGNSSIIIENRVSFVLSNGGPRLRVALESRWITKDRSPQILYSRSFVVLFCTAKLFYVISATEWLQIFLFTGEMCLWKERLAGKWYTNRHTSICYPWYVVYAEGTETSLVWGASMSVVSKSYAVPFCRYDANTECSNI